MVNSDFALQLKNLTVAYNKTPALWDISLDVPQENIVGIIGPNGAGKSTLIKAALGLIRPISGSVLLLGNPLELVRTKIAYVPQKESVDWNFPISVKELIIMGRYGKIGLCRCPSKHDWDITDKYLQQVGMYEYRNRQIGQLSTGQQQRIFLARALAQEADIYFLDEPFSGIDMTTEQALVEILRELKNQGKTVFVVHHDLNAVESYFDWLILLNQRLIVAGKTNDVLNADHLKAAYGKSFFFLSDALKLPIK